MTIGIAAFGPQAGLGVFMGLQVAERVGEGSIGGFAVYRVITSDGRLVTFKTQRGGSATLVTRGEATGGLPPEDVQDARIAALISSGPDRPEPLERALPGDPQAGLVTGHRIPMAPTKRGTPLNLAVLELLRQGVPASQAVDMLMDEHPQIDAGIIAVDVKGDLGARNSRRVLGRSDVLEVRKEEPGTGCKVAVFINEIHPKEAAVVAAAKCMQVMVGERKPDMEVTVRCGLKVFLGDEDLIEVDNEGVAVRITTTDPTILNGEQVCVVPYLGASVYREGEFLGRIISEPLTVLRDGVIVDLVGQQSINLPVRK